MFDSNVARKNLRSILERFKLKITVIEESKDIDRLKLNKLIGNMQIYEKNHHKKKSKGLVLNNKI